LEDAGSYSLVLKSLEFNTTSLIFQIAIIEEIERITAPVSAIIIPVIGLVLIITVILIAISFLKRKRKSGKN